MKTIPKQKNHAFGKDIYLLGQDREDYNVYLESPSWDCGWYWGFGYIERYTNKTNPSIARDVIRHSHWDGEIVGQKRVYDVNKKCWVNRKYIHHINENPEFISTVLTDHESWVLAELMRSFYILKKAAEFYHHGGAYITTNPLSDFFKSKEQYDHINIVLLPRLFEEIDKILTP